MKVTVINNKKDQEIFPIGSLLLLVLGIFLTFNAEGVLSSISRVLYFKAIKNIVKPFI